MSPYICLFFKFKSNLSIFSLMGHAPNVILKIFCLTQGHKDFLSCFLLNVFLKYVSPFEIFWPFSPSRHFEGRFHLQPCSTCSYEVTISSGFKSAFAGNGQRAAAFLRSPCWYQGNRPTGQWCSSVINQSATCPGKPTNVDVSLLLFVFKFNLYLLLE